MEESKQSPKKRRNEIILTMIALFFVIGVSLLSYWYYLSLHYETTQDAYVEGNITRLSAQIPSFVKSIHYQEGSFVQKGQLLVELDSQISSGQLQQAEAFLALTVRQAEGLFQKVQQAQQGLLLSKIQKNEAHKIASHRNRIASSGALPGEEVDRAQSGYEAAEAQWRIAEFQNKEAHALTHGTSVTTHPSVQQATSQYIQAFVNNKRACIYAPFDGYVVQKLAHVGETVGPGAPLICMIPKGQLWVTANFQETQLRRIRPGQTVYLKADMYAGLKEYRGVVRGVVPSTGSYLTLLPPQNATGNWVKVVQRIPVMIEVPELQKDQSSYPLLMGLSMEAQVEIEETGLSLLPQYPQMNFKIESTVDSHYYQEAKLRADAIIAENRSA